MSNTVNFTSQTGRLVRDPDIRQVGDSEVAKITVATDRTWYDKNKQNDDGTTGGWHSVPSFHKCEIWKPGKKLKEATKGMMVQVVGTYEDNNWEDKEGVKHFDKVIKVRQYMVMPLGKGQIRTEEEREKANPEAQPNYSDAPAPEPPPPPQSGHDDLPF